MAIMTRRINWQERFVKSSATPQNAAARTTRMHTQELYDRGWRLRNECSASRRSPQRRNPLGEFGAPLQTNINAYTYGEVWSRPGLPQSTRSLGMFAIMAVIGRSAEYCGLPAGNEAQRVALEVLKEYAAADSGKPQT